MNLGPEDVPDIPTLLEDLLFQGRDCGASDLHLEPTESGALCRYRVDGVFVDSRTITSEQTEGILVRLKVMARIVVHRSDIPQDGQFSLVPEKKGQALELRLSIMPTVRGEKAVIRFYDPKGRILSIDELGFSDSMTGVLRKSAAGRDGLLLLCGPSGSGKTTTIYALLNEILTNRGNRSSIVSLEDPVERRIQGITQIQVSSEENMSYASILKSLMRQDPEVIAVGEIRDPETAEVVLRASLTGHLVISTLHCGRANEALDRLTDLGLPRPMILGAIKGVLAQRLVRKYCDSCQGRGCKDCGQSGFRGRVPFAEYLDGNQLRRLPGSPMDTGFHQLRESGLELVGKNVTSPEELNQALEEAP